MLVEVRQPGAPPLLVVVRDRLEVGRDAEGLLLRDPKASRRHAELRVGTDGLTIVDLGSTNGTFVNGEAVRDAPVPVRPGDDLLVGGTELAVLGPIGTPDVGRPPAPDSTSTTSIQRLAAAVRDDRRDLDSVVRRGGTVTILFSDIESSTDHATALGDVAWYRLLEVHDRRVREVVGRHGGVVVKHQGDGFMVSFESAAQAVLCAIALQRAVCDRGTPEAARGLRVRIGAHIGEALRLGDTDWIGHHVMVASRIADAAEGGHILVSALVWELTRARPDLPYGDPIDVPLKGLGTHTVREVEWWSYPVT